MAIALSHICNDTYDDDVETVGAGTDAAELVDVAQQAQHHHAGGEEEKQKGDNTAATATTTSGAAAAGPQLTRAGKGKTSPPRLSGESKGTSMQ